MFKDEKIFLSQIEFRNFKQEITESFTLASFMSLLSLDFISLFLGLAVIGSLISMVLNCYKKAQIFLHRFCIKPRLETFLINNKVFRLKIPSFAIFTCSLPSKINVIIKFLFYESFILL